MEKNWPAHVAASVLVTIAASLLLSGAAHIAYAQQLCGAAFGGAGDEEESFRLCVGTVLQWRPEVVQVAVDHVLETAGAPQRAWFDIESFTLPCAAPTSVSP